MEFSAQNAASATDGTLENAESDIEILHISRDSRNTIPPNSLYVALRGEHFDGHDFVGEAFDKGAEVAMVSEVKESWADEPLIVVEDTLDALQALGNHWRRRFDIPVVAITGSNGKTVVKEMLASILSREWTVYRSPRSYNSQVGVPLSLLGIEPEHDIAVIEVGISTTGEMESLRQTVEPTAGILTNIGRAHMKGLGDLETTAREKLKLFEHFDDEWLVHPETAHPLEDVEFMELVEPEQLPTERICFDVTDRRPDPTVDVSVCDPETDKETTTFSVARRGEKTDRRYALNVPGRHNLYNAAAAIASADELGASDEAISNGLAAFELSPMRLEFHTTERGITLINDAYSSDPVSAGAALQTLHQYAGEGRSIAIFGDMRDLGDYSEKAHRELGKKIATNSLDCLICHGEDAHFIGDEAVRAGFDPERVHYTRRLDEVHSYLNGLLEQGDTVLFKASRSLHLERAAEQLLESVAPRRLTIDLGAIRSNYHRLRGMLAEETGFMAVVKSFGYGNNSTRIAQVLIQEGIDALAVAYPDEAIPLRDKGIEIPILVLNSTARVADKIVKYRLTPLVYSTSVLDALEAEIKRQGRTITLHLPVDTGMNRIGISPDRVLEFARDVESRQGLTLSGLMTHFAAADDPGEDDFTERQLDLFEQTVDELAENGIEPDVLHAANTAATWRFPESQFDMVRVGLGLYGLFPNAELRDRFGGDPALRFTTELMHIQDIRPGETVSYNRTWKADRARRIGAIAAGYNDGFPRFMSNGGEVLIRGQRCPVVGNVCMDVAMVDITNVPEASVGDEVVIFGSQRRNRISVDEIARRGNTINYEILCNISPRVQRIFRDTTET